MIRINLLGGERKAAKRAPTVQAGQKITIISCGILVTAVCVVGWRFWTLREQSANLDKNIAAAQQETVRLHAIIQNVQQFEQQRAQLQQRVVLIEQLRKSQTGPVHMLDEISRALPSMLWLTQLKASDDSVVIDGQCLALTNLTDFVANLEASGFFKRSVDIVSSQTEVLTTPPGELVKFSVRAQYAQVAPKAPGAAAAAKKQGS